MKGTELLPGPQQAGYTHRLHYFPKGQRLPCLVQACLPLVLGY